MPPQLFQKAKNALEKKEADIKGKEWLAEVREEGTEVWKPLEEWRAQYEPTKEKKPESAQQAQHKAKAAAKLKETIMSKLHLGVTDKLMLVLMEVTSVLFSKVETELPAESPVRTLLNSANAVVLSYRFGYDPKKKQQRKLAYLRKTATEAIVAIVDQALPDANDTSQLLAMQTDVRQTILARQDQAIEMMSARLDEVFAVASKSVDEKVESKLAQAQDQVTQVQRQAETALNIVGAQDLKPDGDVTIDVSAAKQTKDDLVATFSAMFKSVILDKVKDITTTLADVMDRLLASTSTILLVLHTSKARSSEEGAVDKVSASMDDSFAQLKAVISAEVKRFIDLLGGLMQMEEEDDDEDK